MKRNRLIVVAALLAALGVGGWALFGRGGGKGGGAPAAKGPEPKGKGGAAGASGGGGGALQIPEGMNVLIDDDREGTLRLEGIVLDADEQPVGGATVTLSTNPPRQTTSEADGSFAFDKLVGRQYRLVAVADAGVAGPVMARLTAKSDPVTLRLVPAAAVEVTVVTAADRKPVAGADVELRGLATLRGTTGADGKLRFDQVAPGGYQAVAWAPGHAKSFDWMRVGRGDAGGQVVEKVTLGLRRGAPVAGVVRDPAGKPVAGALVAYAGVSEWAQRADARRDAVTTDDEGRFRFEALSAGTYRFVARDEAHAPGTSAQVTLDGQSERGGVEIVMQPAALIAGKVVDKQGAPVPFAVVRVSEQGQGAFSFEDARQTACDDQGAFEMRALPRKPLQVVALHETATSHTVEVDVSATPERRDLVIPLDNTATIAGVVVDAQGEPIAEATVFAMPDFRRGDRAARAEWRLRGAGQELTDQGGRFVLRGLNEGDYVLRASRPGQARRGGPFGGPDGVEASTGDENVRIELPTDGGVKGRVLRADGSAPELFSVSMGPFGGTPFSGGDGSFQLDDVPPGEVNITVSGPGFDRKSVRAKVEPDKLTDLGTITVTEGRKIIGRVVDAAGTPVANAQVVAGRRLVGSGASLAGEGTGGPRGMSGLTRSATSDERGEFVLYGVGNEEMALAAEHETAGRSTTVLVAGGSEHATVEIRLAPFGALEGVVTKDGAPLGEIGINVSSQTVPNSNFLVQTGPDGAFRYDRLAADSYLVSAVGGQNPMQGMSFSTKVVKVEPGKTTQVRIEVAGGATVVARPELAGGGRIQLAQVHAVGAKITAKNARELSYAIARAGASFSSFGLAMGGNPARIQNVPAGTYTVCAIPFPEEVRGMGPIFEYLQREGDRLPVYCAAVTVAAGQDAEVTIPVPSLPAYVPPPADAQGGGGGPGPAGPPGGRPRGGT